MLAYTSVGEQRRTASKGVDERLNGTSRDRVCRRHAFDARVVHADAAPGVSGADTERRHLWFLWMPRFAFDADGEQRVVEPLLRARRPDIHRGFCAERREGVD